MSEQVIFFDRVHIIITNRALAKHLPRGVDAISPFLIYYPSK